MEYCVLLILHCGGDVRYCNNVPCSVYDHSSRPEQKKKVGIPIQAPNVNLKFNCFNHMSQQIAGGRLHALSHGHENPWHILCYASRPCCTRSICLNTIQIHDLFV